MLATLAFNSELLRKIARLKGLTTDQKLAEHIEVSSATVSRVMKGQCRPGHQFIAGVLKTFGAEWFFDVFTVVEDDSSDDDDEAVAS